MILVNFEILMNLVILVSTANLLLLVTMVILVNLLILVVQTFIQDRAKECIYSYRYFNKYNKKFPEKL